MESILRMPGNFCALSEEEMSYIDGGSTLSYFVTASIGAALAANYVVCLTEARHWYGMHQTGNIGRDFANGMEALSDYISESFSSAVRGISAAAVGVALWPVTLIAFATVPKRQEMRPGGPGHGGPGGQPMPI